LLYTEDFQPSPRALAPYYRVRDVLASTPRGTKLVDLYYTPETKERTFDALQGSPDLRIDGLALIVELESVVANLTGSNCVMRNSHECGRADDATRALLPADVMKRAERFLERLEEASGAHELIALTRELLYASANGSLAVVRWLKEEDG
jgi:hypothetical protein